MTGSGDEEIRRRLRRAADEVLARHGEARARRRLSIRWAAVAVPGAALLAALSLVAVQLIGSEQPGSLFDPGAVASSSEDIGPDPSPTVTPTSSPHPSPDPSPPDPVRTAQASPAPSPTAEARWPCQPVMPERAPDGIEVTVEPSAPDVEQDGRISFTVRMRNNGLQPVSNQRSSQEYDVLVRRAGSDTAGDIWLWSHQFDAWPQPLIMETYAPGEERDRTEDWNVRSNCAGAPLGRLPQGRYQAYGIWITFDGTDTQGWWSEPVAFEIR